MLLRILLNTLQRNPKSKQRNGTKYFFRLHIYTYILESDATHKLRLKKKQHRSIYFAIVCSIIIWVHRFFFHIPLLINKCCLCVLKDTRRVCVGIRADTQVTYVYTCVCVNA